MHVGACDTQYVFSQQCSLPRDTFTAKKILLILVAQHKEATP